MPLLRPRRRPAALLLVSLGAALALGVWLWPAEREAGEADQAAQALPAQTGASAAGAGGGGADPWQMLARASARAEASLPRLAGSDEAALRRLDAEWCASRGALIAAQIREAEQRSDPPPGLVEREEQELAQGLADLLQSRAAAALRERGDARSLAVAELLALLNGEPNRPENRQAANQLLAQARASNDALLLVLARRWACTSSACQQELAERWLQLEPSNLQALLAVGPGQQLDAWLLRLATAQRSQDHRAALFELLLELPPPPAGGLAEAALAMRLSGLHAAWIAPVYQPLLETCRGTALAGQGARTLRCATIAERLWSLAGDDSLQPRIALRLAAEQPLLRQAWQQRAEQFEAAELLQQHTQTAQREGAREARQFACRADAADRAALRARLVDGEWPRAQAALRQADEEPAELAQQYRRLRGRSLLDPQPD